MQGCESPASNDAKIIKNMYFGKFVGASNLEKADPIVLDHSVHSFFTNCIILQETGKVFAGVLEDAGVYKNTPEGKAAFQKFVDYVNQEA